MFYAARVHRKFKDRLWYIKNSGVSDKKKLELLIGNMDYLAEWRVKNGNKQILYFWRPYESWYSKGFNRDILNKEYRRGVKKNAEI